ncbi:hypothetical protein ACIQ2D_02120 [Lysinibacillus sp. NPDC097287]|uniref:hypothetical protein n=1 Tax=Lysinibacillus sp. NPDC097287 TaxID=3364144 RepID=UPI00382921D9
MKCEKTVEKKILVELRYRRRLLGDQRATGTLQEQGERRIKTSRPVTIYLRESEATAAHAFMTNTQLPQVTQGSPPETRPPGTEINWFLEQTLIFVHKE